MNKFTKADLKPGMIVKIRKGGYRIVYHFKGAPVLVGDSTYITLEDHNDDLSSSYNKKLDIVEVKNPSEVTEFIPYKWHDAPTIWERKELPKMTEVERVILENARLSGKRPEWIGRDRSETLHLYVNDPEKGKDAWISNLGDYVWFNAYNHLFQFVKWEDEEPWYIPDLLGDVDE